MLKRYNIFQNIEGESDATEGGVIISIETPDNHKKSIDLAENIIRAFESIQEIKDEDGNVLEDLYVQEIDFYKEQRYKFSVPIGEISKTE